MQRLAPLNATVGPPYFVALRIALAAAAGTTIQPRLPSRSTASVCPESRRQPRPPTCTRRHLSRPAYASIPARRRSAACRVPRTPGSGWRRRSTARPRHAPAGASGPVSMLRTGPPRRSGTLGDETRPASRSAGRSTAGPGPAPGGSRTSNTTGSDRAGRSPGSDRSVMIAYTPYIAHDRGGGGSRLLGRSLVLSSGTPHDNLRPGRCKHYRPAQSYPPFSARLSRYGRPPGTGV